MARDVDLRDALRGYAVDIGKRVKTVILRRNINIIYVQENSAVSLLDNLIQEFPFGHLRHMIFGVTADVFDGDRNLQEVAYFANFLRGQACRFKGVRHGQKVVCIASVDAAPAKVIG